MVQRVGLRQQRLSETVRRRVRGYIPTTDLCNHLDHHRGKAEVSHGPSRGTDQSINPHVESCTAQQSVVSRGHLQSKHIHKIPE